MLLLTNSLFFALKKNAFATGIKLAYSITLYESDEEKDINC